MLRNKFALIIFALFFMCPRLVFAEITYGPKVLIDYVIPSNGEHVSDPAAHCNAISGSVFTGPNSNGVYNCNLPAFGSNWNYAPQYACPSGWTDSGLTDPSVACMTEGSPPDPDCDDKIGQTETIYLACEVATCPSGWYISVNDKWGCNPPGSVVWAPLPLPGSTSIDGCKANFLSKVVANKGKRDTPVGSPELQVYCDVTYIITGEEAGETPPPPEGSETPPTPATAPPLEDGNQGAGVNTDGSSGGGGTGTGSEPGGTSGTGGGTQNPCVPTAENPCTQTGGGSYDCVPTVTNPCTGTGTSNTAKCDVSPVCTGDAIQCAQVIQTWKSVCELNKNLTDFPDELKSTLAEYNNAGQSDSVVSGASSEFSARASAFSSIFGTSPSGSCISDISLNVLSASVTIPLSELCGFLTFLRLLLHLGVDYVALRIIARAVLGE